MNQDDDNLFFFRLNKSYKSDDMFLMVVLVVHVTTFKMTRKPVKLQKESPAGCAGEGKQSKGN